MKNYRLLFLSAFILLSIIPALAQNKFEGYNLFLDVPEDHKSMACALRYVSPETEITITDLNTSTPIKVSNCGESPAKERLLGNGLSDGKVRSLNSFAADSGHETSLVA